MTTKQPETAQELRQRAEELFSASEVYNVLRNGWEQRSSP